MKITKPVILPKEPKGETSSEPIWTSVGWALSRWEDLQSRLMFLFMQTAQQSGGNYALFRAFGYNMVVSTKLDMIEHAAAVTLEENRDLLEKTRSLLNLIRGFNERRNDIAHGITRAIDPYTSHGVYLVPTHTTTKKMKLGKWRMGEIGPPDYCWNNFTVPSISSARRAHSRSQRTCATFLAHSFQQTHCSGDVAARGAQSESCFGVEVGNQDCRHLFD